MHLADHLAFRFNAKAGNGRHAFLDYNSALLDYGNYDMFEHQTFLQSNQKNEPIEQTVKAENDKYGMGAIKQRIEIL